MTDEELRRCREEVRELAEENRTLRKAAYAFGGLAERLNEELHAERRGSRDRRQTPRSTPERRQSS